MKETGFEIVEGRHRTSVELAQNLLAVFQFGVERSTRRQGSACGVGWMLVFERVTHSGPEMEGRQEDSFRYRAVELGRRTQCKRRFD